MLEDVRKQKLEMLREAEAKLQEAIALVDEGTRNTNIRLMAERHILPELRKWANGAEEHTSIVNLIKGLGEQNDDPVWTRPLNSVKYPK